MKQEESIKIAKEPKNITGTVISIKRDAGKGLKYSLASGNTNHIPGAQLEILVNGKLEIAKIPDTHIDYLRENLLNREVHYNYTKRSVNGRDTLHHWECQIETIDSDKKFKKKYTRAF